MTPGQEVAFIHDGWLGFGLLTCIKTCETLEGSTTSYTVRRNNVDYEVTEDQIDSSYSFGVDRLCLRIQPTEVQEAPAITSVVEAPKDVSF